MPPPSDYDTNTGALAVQGAICGAVIGVAQAIVLHRRLGRIVLGLAGRPRRAVGARLDITASAGIDVEAQYTVFGSSGALVVTAGTSVLPIVLATAARTWLTVTRRVSSDTISSRRFARPGIG